MEIEYCIGSAFQRNGFATEATKAVIKYGFNVMHLHKIQICSMTINDASMRVIEKCGFKYEGILMDCFYINEKYIRRAYFSLLSDEYVNSIKYLIIISVIFALCFYFFKIFCYY